MKTKVPTYTMSDGEREAAGIRMPPRGAPGQSTYQYMCVNKDGLGKAIDPIYKQFDPPMEVKAVPMDRLDDVFTIYESAGVDLDQIAHPEVAFSIKAIEHYNPDLHSYLARAITTQATLQGVNPGMAILAREALRYGVERLTNEKLIATEYLLNSRVKAGSPVVPSEQAMREYIESVSPSTRPRTPLPRNATWWP